MNSSTPKAVPPREVRAGGSPAANLALGLSIAAVIAWLAGAVADELYLVMAVLAVAGVVVGVRARGHAGSATPGRGRSAAAIILGGVLSALFVAFLIAALATGDLQA